VHTLADFQLVDIFSTPSNVYRQVPANQAIDFVAEFIFPDDLAQSMPNEIVKLVTPAPGQYFLRFVYISYEGNQDLWSGSIGSNRIEICILN